MNVRKLAPPARVGQSAMRTDQFVDILWINLTAQSAAIQVLGGESTKNILFFSMHFPIIIIIIKLVGGLGMGGGLFGNLYVSKRLSRMKL